MTGQPEFDTLTPEQAMDYCCGSESQRVRAVIAERVGGHTVVDLGCGNGIDAPRYRQEQYVGVDGSAELIAAAQRLHPAHTFQQHDLRRLPFNNQAFDYAIIKSVLEHVASEADAVQIVREAQRIARTVFVAWHTPPLPIGCSIIQQVKGHFGFTVYQNRYSTMAFDEFLPRDVQPIDNFILWTLTLSRP